MKLESQNIVLVGLPGSGKSLVAESLHRQFDCSVLDEQSVSVNNQYIEFTRPGIFEWLDLSHLPILSEQYFVYCVIDIRSVLLNHTHQWPQQVLQQLLNLADGVVFSFTENSSLSDQAWWNQWLAQNSPLKRLPVVRLLNQNLPKEFKGFEKQNNPILKKSEVETQSTQNKQWLPLTEVQCFDFYIERVMLDHLLMVLDNARQNLQTNITRVTGVVNTFEYQNLVQLEGTPYRWDTFAADQSFCDDQKKHLDRDVKVGQITVCGTGINQNWLAELIQACKV